jgi:hypothetical protein
MRTCHRALAICILAALGTACAPVANSGSIPQRTERSTASAFSAFSLLRDGTAIQVEPGSKIRWALESHKPILQLWSVKNLATVRGNVLQVIAPSTGRTKRASEWKQFRKDRWYSLEVHQARGIATNSALRRPSLVNDPLCYFDELGNPVCPDPIGSGSGGGCDPSVDPTCAGACNPSIDPWCPGFCSVNPTSPVCQPPPPPLSAPVYASNPEVPDDPDGPGHGPQPDLSVPFDQACPNGWSLAFSDGSGGNPIGGAYCGVDLSGEPTQEASLVVIGAVRFRVEHYWNRHLACYVHQNYTSDRWNRDLIGPDFQSQVVKPVTTTSIHYIGSGTVVDSSGSSSGWGYRASLVGAVTTPLVTVNTFQVGTSYLVPQRNDCPKPYPNYP